jgi:excisionase family DNA binding protein
METTLNPDANPNQLLNADQVAERLNISRALAYRLMKSGEIPTVRFIGSVRVCESDLQAFIETHRLGQ